jgi:hypothetical protein
MRKIEVKLIIEVSHHCDIDDDLLISELEKDINYGFSEITGFSNFEIENIEIIN